jgi:uncharacterized protein (TIGR02996 family)
MIDLSAGFLADILEHPADDTHRLVFADYLDDRGDHDRAEFIRIQCALEVVRAGCCCGSCVQRYCPGGQHHNGPCALRAREHRHLRYQEFCLLNQHAEEWFTLDGWRPQQTGSGGQVFYWAQGSDFLGEGESGSRRGFIEVLHLTAEDWLRHADALVKLTPIRQVHLTTMPLVQFRTEPARGGMSWTWLAGRKMLGCNKRLHPVALLFHYWPRICFFMPKPGRS